MIVEHSSAYVFGYWVGRLLVLLIPIAIVALILTNDRARKRRLREAAQTRWDAIVARFGPDVGARLFAGDVRLGDSAEMLSAAFGPPSVVYEDPAGGGQIAIWFVPGQPHRIARQVRLVNGVLAG